MNFNHVQSHLSYPFLHPLRCFSFPASALSLPHLLNPLHSVTVARVDLVERLLNRGRATYRSLCPWRKWKTPFLQQPATASICLWRVGAPSSPFLTYEGIVKGLITGRSCAGNEARSAMSQSHAEEVFNILLTYLLFPITPPSLSFSSLASLSLCIACCHKMLHRSRLT